MSNAGNFSGSDDEGVANHVNHASERRMSAVSSTCYRMGSVSQDTNLCLWDITEDMLRSPVCAKQRANSANSFTISGSFSSGNGTASSGATMNHQVVANNAKHNNTNHVASYKENASGPPANAEAGNAVASLTQRLFGERKLENHKRNFSLTIRGNSNGSNIVSNSVGTTGGAGTGAGGGGGGGSGGGGTLAEGKKASTGSALDDPMRLIGTPCCPRFDECPVLEPLVTKKLAHERLTELVFLKDCFVTACQDGYVYTWARPGHTVGPLTISNTLHRPHHHSHPYTNINSIRPNDL